MDFISSSLVTLYSPTGFWQSILNAFKNGMGTYIVAVIVLAILVRIVFSLVDIINKKVSMKNSDINAKMKPELDAIKAKYGNDPQVMQKKTSDVYKKYQFSMMGSCVPMLIAMVLQFTVFLTLWNSLQAVANFNIASQYQEMKNIYANVININNNRTVLDAADFEETDRIAVEIVLDEGTGDQVQIKLSKDGENYNTIGAVTYDRKLAESNDAVYNLLEKYVIEPKPEEETETSSNEYAPTKYSAALKVAAEEAVKEYFQNSKEGFLWIKNIYKSESPTSPMFSKKEITTYLSKYYTEEEKAEEAEFKFEEKIFDCMIGENIQLESIQSQKNGYYILTIIAVAVCFFSLWLSNKLMQGKNKATQKQSWAMYVIMPVIYGIFTFTYTSLFAIYLIVGQLVMVALTPLTTWIVRKWIEHDNNKKSKKDENVIEVDYRRKES